MRTRHLAGGTALSVLLATASLLGVTATPAAADNAAPSATSSEAQPTLHALDDPAQAATTLTVSVPATAVPGAEVTVTGTLGSAEPFAAGTEVTITRTDPADTAGTPLGTAAVAEDGTFQLKDTPAGQGVNTYWVSYAGDATHAATAATGTVTVTRASTTLNVSAPATALPGAEVTISGSLGSTEDYAPGTTVTITRTDSHGGTGTPLGTATIGEYNIFQLKDTPAVQGNNTYTVSYAGDATHAAATARRTVNVTRAATTLTVNAPATAKRATKITVTGKLTAAASFPAGTKVTVTRIDLTTPKGKSLGSKTVASNGTFSFTDTPYTGGSVTYSVHYSGDTTHTAALGKDTVSVSRAATSVSIKTNHSTYSWGSTATVTGHLGKTGKSRVVSIYAKAADGTKKLVKTGTVNRSGDFKVTYKLYRNTTFWASFGGDFYSAPKSVSRSVGTQIKVSTSVNRHYRTGKIGSTTYYWFHRNTDPVFTTSMSYYKNRAQRFELQVYYQGKWYDGGSEYFRLATNGKSAVQLEAPGESGIRARMRSSYVKGSSGDSVNTTTHGSWKYMYFTK
ncbi:Ig-like domain repeat protein [Actinacidiphila glaucinigra]|uniref:Ig-like domain repeat protein n=1 Tax=Actinacidiphila glaucinigra TaxID=235986 RepID=UPI0037CB7C5B